MQESTERRAVRTMGASSSKEASHELVEACTTLDGIAEIASLFREAANGTSPQCARAPSVRVRLFTCHM